MGGVSYDILVMYSLEVLHLTVQLCQPSLVALPDCAVMLTGALSYHFG